MPDSASCAPRSYRRAIPDALQNLAQPDWISRIRSIDVPELLRTHCGVRRRGRTIICPGYQMRSSSCLRQEGLGSKERTVFHNSEVLQALIGWQRAYGIVPGWKIRWRAERELIASELMPLWKKWIEVAIGWRPPQKTQAPERTQPEFSFFNPESG